MSKRRIYLYDTTLRDGLQGRGVDLTLEDRFTVAQWLNSFGIAYIEGGWPGSSPKDTAFFDQCPPLDKARLTAFGMTQRARLEAKNDEVLMAVLNSPVNTVCLVGKNSIVHVLDALEIPPEENLQLITDSIRLSVSLGKEVLFDAEHVFDGYKADPEYTLACLKAAYESGASWLVLCDTNGGTLPHEIDKIVREIAQALPKARFGIHCHNDTGNAVANSLMAVMASPQVQMIQGTLNGVGERCGNADLVTLIPTLAQKLGYDTGVTDENLVNLKCLSQSFDALRDEDPNPQAPYVGESAFTHKAGLHVSAILKNPPNYEHTEPASVGNRRAILMSDKSGLSNLRHNLKELGINGDINETAILAALKQREFEGFSYDGALGSFAVLALRESGRLHDYFKIASFHVTDGKKRNAQDRLEGSARARVKVRMGKSSITARGNGLGPVHALDSALRNALVELYPELDGVHLIDYRVRILNPSEATGAKTRVRITSQNTTSGVIWETVGVSTDIIEASLQALEDSYLFKLALAHVEQRALPRRPTRAQSPHGTVRHNDVCGGALIAAPV